MTVFTCMDSFGGSTDSNRWRARLDDVSHFGVLGHTIRDMSYVECFCVCNLSSLDRNSKVDISIKS